MSSAVRWNASGSRELPIVARPRWAEIRQGLTLTWSGYFCFLFLALPGLLLATPAATRLSIQLNLAEELPLLGAGLALLGLIVGFILFQVGQVRCLLSSPQGQGARELLFAALLASLIAPFFFLAGHLVGGAENYKLLERGPAGLADLSIWRVGTLLQALSLGLIVVNILLFSGFMRVLANYLNDSAHARSITCYVWFLAFLGGATVGVVMYAGRITLDIWSSLVVAWAFGILWHAVLILVTRRFLTKALSGSDAGDPFRVKAKKESGEIVLRAGSFFRQ